MHYLIAVCLACGIGLLFQTPVFSQDAGASDTTPGEPPGGYIDSPYPGPLGQVDNREPHDACADCFTVPGMGEGYQIFESVPVGVNSEKIIMREIANPAPLEEGEVRPTHDGDDPLWYIGRQAYSGPQDTEAVSVVYDKPIIALKRIRARNEERILSIAGVHGFGLVETGLGVWVLPGSDTTAIPKTLEGVPVTVFVQSRPILQQHANTWFRPVPAGARISSSEPGTGINLVTVEEGTLGPHIVRTNEGCCLVWSLTAAHVVREYLDDPVPDPGSIPIYQPTVRLGNRFGYVAHVFRLESCGTPGNDADCYGVDPIINDTMVNPDIAAIDPDPYGVKVAYPYNNPSGTDPIRRLQKTASSYTNGPSGVIRAPRTGDWLNIYGAYGGKLKGEVFGTGLVIVPANITDTGDYLYRYCCVTGLTAPTKGGDSGAIVTYRGTGSRHVAGVHVAGDGINAWSIPSSHIYSAFDAVDRAFSHYWGTKEGYREPSDDQCDPPGC